MVPKVSTDEHLMTQTVRDQIERNRISKQNSVEFVKWAENQLLQQETDTYAK